MENRDIPEELIRPEKSTAPEGNRSGNIPKMLMDNTTIENLVNSF